MPVSPCRGAAPHSRLCCGAEHIQESEMPVTTCRGAEFVEEKTAEEAPQEPLTALDERELSFLRA